MLTPGQLIALAGGWHIASMFPRSRERGNSTYRARRHGWHRHCTMILLRTTGIIQTFLSNSLRHDFAAITFRGQIMPDNLSDRAFPYATQAQDYTTAASSYPAGAAQRGMAGKRQLRPPGLEGVRPERLRDSQPHRIGRDAGAIFRR